MLAENINQIKRNIQLACEQVHRSKDDITMVAVTKTVGNKEIKQLVDLGIENFAENRVDQLLEKKESFKNYPYLKWHFIGNLQRRKIKLIIDEIDFFHALASIKVAEEIQKRSKKLLPCFVQVNISGETTKHGLPKEEVELFIRQLSKYDRIQVIGLMTMAPLKASETELHNIFSQLKYLQMKIANLQLAYAPCTELSMGMSNDYGIAIQEGTTFIRIGSAVFRGA